jgi:serine/threonine-protein kinase
VAALADLAVTEGRQSSYLPYFQFCKGLAEYRQARFTSAADWMEVVLTNRMGVLSLDTSATMVLAMAEYRSGHREQARASLAKGSEIEERLPRLESGDLGDDWNNWIIAQALSREAKALIEGQPGPHRQPQDRSE